MYSFKYWALLLSASAFGQDLITALQSQQDLSTLYETLLTVPDVASLLNSSTNLTILAPTNDAFEQLLNAPLNAENLALSSGDPNGTTNLLSYHVLKGYYPSSTIGDSPTYVQTLFTSAIPILGNARTNVTGGQHVGVVNNGSNVLCLSGDLQFSVVTQADIIVNGIVVHKIDRVLSIPNNITTTGPEFGLTAAVGAIQEAGLAETLDIVPDLTLFVPNNAAFEAIGSILATASLETIQAVLQYHAVVGTVAFSDDISNTTIASVQGNDLTLSVIGDTIFVNTARVVVPNIILTGGVAHVIDAVLNPEAGEVDRDALDPSASPSPAFPGASSASVPFVTAAPSATTTRSIPAVLTTAPLFESSSSPIADATSSTTPPLFTGGAISSVEQSYSALTLGILLAWLLPI